MNEPILVVSLVDIHIDKNHTVQPGDKQLIGSPLIYKGGNKFKLSNNRRNKIRLHAINDDNTALISFSRTREYTRKTTV